MHGRLPQSIKSCDLLLIAGDVCGHVDNPGSVRDMTYQAKWLNTTFRKWQEDVYAKKIVGICGNHDFVFEQRPDLIPLDLPWTYLQDSSTTVNGVKVWGSPMSLFFFSWAFNAPEEGGEEALTALYARIPKDTDIIISHGPPFGYGDRTIDGRYVGSHALVDAIDRIKPRYVITGHIHEAYGSYERGGTTIINASVLDEKYKLVNEPIYLEI